MRIALTQRVLVHKGREYDSIERSWYSVLKGHTLIFIPNDINASIDADLLIVTGGEDHPVRVQLEERLIQQMIADHKPIIGICHGAFLLTKILGGVVSPIEGHMDQTHNIKMGDEVVSVNSYHTQQIEQAPLNAKILAQDQAGLCESWIYNNVGAVVWHPERMEHPVWPAAIKELLNEEKI